MNEINKINKIFEGYIECCIQSFSSGNLTVIGSFDLSSYHHLELIFSEVSYVSLPTDFYNPYIRMATADEVDRIGKFISVSENKNVYCIEAESYLNQKKLPFYITAKDISFKEGYVYYYKRENLKENERIASWV